MIIWLASYPRSGNTLTRTLIKSCFGLDSYNDEGQHVHKILKSESREKAGHQELSEPWEIFYPKAKASPNLHLVKTHRLPQDDCPAIYVVRDGRSSIWSYFNFLKSYFPESLPSLLKLMVGQDYYGGWSDHVKAWTCQPKGPLLVLRFDELVNADSAVLSRIADFIGFKGNVTAWKNPMQELQSLDPNFYREGKTEWTPPSAWTQEIQRMFQVNHGECQRQLGYECPEPEAGSSQENFLKEFSALAKSLITQNQQLQGVCEERLQLIQLLDTEAKKRLAIIESFQKKTK